MHANTVWWLCLAGMIALIVFMVFVSPLFPLRYAIHSGFVAGYIFSLLRDTQFDMEQELEKRERTKL